jgi:acetolactate synthase-1/2/3 large subunit
MNADEISAEVVAAMVAVGSDTVFGLPGGGNNLSVVGAAEAAGMRFVLAHTETAAVIMAATYAELTGVPTLCIVTRGPGAASAVNGCAQALLDRQPVILLADCVPSSDRSHVSHQLLDQPDLFSSVTKGSAVVGGTDPRATVERALALSTTQPAGPVHLDFDPSAEGSQTEPAVDGHQSGPELAALSDLLSRSIRPVVLVGVGSLAFTESIRRMVAGTDVPVLTTYKARGVVPDSWPNFAGVLTGATIEAPVLLAADLVIAVGLDSVELIPGPWPYQAPLLSIAGWRDEAAPWRASVEVVGEVGALVDVVADSLQTKWETGAGERFRQESADAIRGRVDELTPYLVVQRARELSPPGTIATVDAGAHMLVAMPTWTTEDVGELLISSGLATMGYSLPAAIAAALARPERQVVCFVGDGGLGMTLAELETLARLRLNVTVVVFNDSTLSLIAIKQRSHGQGDRRAVGFAPIDFAGIALACGVPAWRVEDPDAFDIAFAQALTDGGPALLDVAVDPSSYPSIMAAIRGGRTNPGAEVAQPEVAPSE